MTRNRRKKTLFILLATMLFCTSLQAQQYSYGIDPKRDSAAFAAFRVRMDSIRHYRPTVALVLSGGGAKGAAHVSVIRYLDSIGLPVDMVLGTSIGGLFSGLYAVGYSGVEMEQIMRSQDWEYIMRDTHPRKYDDLLQKDQNRQYQFSGSFGLRTWELRSIDQPHQNDRKGLLPDGMVTGRNVENLFASLLTGYADDCDFLKLPTPFVCIATDMVTAKPKVWHSGSLITALRSTMSIPGLFTPVKKDGMVLMDGSMRSNMPAEIARKMGADIVITVDISAPALNANQMNSLVDIIYQTTDILGRESYNAALAATDIYIQPDVSDFSLLSFDTASIATIIDRGRQAVEAHAAELDSLVRRIGVEPRPERKALNIKTTAIVIDTIIFDGLSQKEATKMEKMLDFKKVVMKKHLDDAISTMIGTKTLSKVTYQLMGSERPYTLRFKCLRAPVNEIGAGARFDAIDFASLIVHLGLGAHRLTGSRYDFTARLGLNTIGKFTYTFRTGYGIDIGSSLSFQAARNCSWRSESYDFRVDFNRLRTELYIDFAPSKKLRMQMGARLDKFTRIAMLTDIDVEGLVFGNIEKSNTFPVFFAQVRSDSYDDAYFPTEGSQFLGFYSFCPTGLQHHTPSLHTWHGAWHSALSVEDVTFIPFVEARYISSSIVPYINVLSVSDANRCLDQQINFLGISTPYSCKRTLGSAGINIRNHLNGNHYLTFSTQACRQSDEIRDFYTEGLSFIHVGFSMEYAYKSIVGPLRLNLHWSNFSESLGLYLGLGLEF